VDALCVRARLPAVSCRRQPRDRAGRVRAALTRPGQPWGSATAEAAHGRAAETRLSPPSGGIPILQPVHTAHHPGSGPFLPAALASRALADLAAIAEAMHARRRDPHEIAHALLRSAALHRQAGAALPANIVLVTLRQLPGLSDYDPLADWGERWADVDPDSLADGIDASGGDDDRRAWGRRALLLADWLRDNAGTASTEAAVRAVEREVCDLLEAP